MQNNRKKRKGRVKIISNAKMYFKGIFNYKNIAKFLKQNVTNWQKIQ